MYLSFVRRERYILQVWLDSLGRTLVSMVLPARGLINAGHSIVEIRRKGYPYASAKRVVWRTRTV